VDDVVSFLSQSFYDELAYEGVVLDDEYSHWRLLKFLDTQRFCRRQTLLIAVGKPAPAGLPASVRTRNSNRLLLSLVLDHPNPRRCRCRTSAHPGASRR